MTFSPGLPNFSSDYQEGAHQRVLDALVATNMEQTSGYGTDAHCARARDLIRAACEAPDADVYFLVGGTQTNATVIDAILLPWQGVIAPNTGHINMHEAGIVERGGHKILDVPALDGKINAADVERICSAWEGDGARDHMIAPALVYISQPTEYGTLYTRRELEGLSRVCRARGLKLFVDGARLAYALASPANDVTLADLARLTDVFYIGGTKCGALFGEAVVIPNSGSIRQFVTQMKQHGALLAKGRLLGVQFEALFEDDLYLTIGAPAVQATARIRASLIRAGYVVTMNSPTNLTFVALDQAGHDRLSRKVSYGIWETLPDGRLLARLGTSWATLEQAVAAFEEALA
ncbi:threonine aldolase [Schaalia meyeri]|uniref:Low specificity L-threonine aldolase n=1 Tax=Schaalia meyeri TaxID=52773 RepID=A0AAP9Y8C6_9ACTO|nr:beta-eliminating lyase-related protein [Schaalia meyeri]AKU65295.1 threonine aldolase [Schaalia meyeri]OFQ23153.1 threonine aldolase [Actinomyces sp. HMSC062G12]QQC44010.1 low specificity L-threonine aldolase [Schaalia meyeri]SDR66300.1 L-threonine aldolase [Schaalia meyeri]